MDRMRVIAIARSQIGVRESPWGSNRGNRVCEYQSADFVRGCGYAWCVSFCLWCWRQAGHPLPYKTPGVFALLAWARRHKGWTVPVGGAQPGDIVCFRIGSGHAGLFVRRSGGSVVTIDGNTSNMVAERVRPISSIAGIVHPPGGPPPKPKKVPRFFVMVTSENGHKQVVFTRATPKRLRKWLPKGLRGRKTITIRRSKLKRKKGARK